MYAKGSYANDTAKELLTLDFVLKIAFIQTFLILKFITETNVNRCILLLACKCELVATIYIIKGIFNEYVSWFCNKHLEALYSETLTKTNTANSNPTYNDPLLITNRTSGHNHFLWKWYCSNAYNESYVAHILVATTFTIHLKNRHSAFIEKYNIHPLTTFLGFRWWYVCTLTRIFTSDYGMKSLLERLLVC